MSQESRHSLDALERFDREANPLELDGKQMRALVDLAMERIVAHIDSLPHQPSADTDGAAEMARELRESAPEDGQSVEDLLEFLFETAVPKSFNTAGPGYLAYIPGGGLFHSAVADLLSSSFNRYVGVFAAAPLLAQLEANVLRWFCEAVGYPTAARGILTGGGSLANLTGLVTARIVQLGDDFRGGTIYASDQSHHSVAKAAVLAGFPPANVRRVPSDGRQRIRLDVLRDTIRQDRDQGLRPFLINGNAGTTNTGAVDPLERLADLAAEEQLWLHVDAAYGGFFVLTEEGQEALNGLDRADSIVLDPHKGMFLPYGTGALLVRDGEHLRQAHSLAADYMPPIQDDPDLVDFCEVSPELSRPFRGLRVWLPIKMHGLAAFRSNLEEKLELARWLAGQIDLIEHTRVTCPPQLSLFAFRVEPPGLDEGELDALNLKIMDRVNRRGRVYLTGTRLDGRFVIRACVLSFRTHLDRIQMALEDIRAEIADA